VGVASIIVGVATSLSTNLAPLLMYFLLYWNRLLATSSRVEWSTGILGWTSGVSLSTTASTCQQDTAHTRTAHQVV